MHFKTRKALNSVGLGNEKFVNLKVMDFVGYSMQK